MTVQVVCDKVSDFVCNCLMDELVRVVEQKVSIQIDFPPFGVSSTCTGTPLRIPDGWHPVTLKLGKGMPCHTEALLHSLLNLPLDIIGDLLKRSLT
jgi:hypothetical protein